MGDGPFQTSRQNYIEPRESGVCCVGSEAECRFLIGDGATYLPWDEQPAQLAQIGALYLMPAPDELGEARLPSFVPELRAATLLALPASMLATLNRERVPARLVTLQIDLDRRFTDALECPPRWPDALVLPQLRGLLFMGADDSSGDWANLGVEPRHVPGLEFLGSDVDEEGRVVDALAGFVELRHLELGEIRDFDRLFEVVPPGIKVLRLGGSGSKFSLAGIIRLRRLAALRCESIHTEIDCRLFCELPELVELDLLECRRVVNVEALLECPMLRRVSLVDCGGCFEGPLRQRFAAHGFEALDIGEPRADL